MIAFIYFMINYDLPVGQTAIVGVITAMCTYYAVWLDIKDSNRRY